MRVHEGDGLVTVGTLLGVTLIQGVHHQGHLLPGAAQRLLTLLSQLPVSHAHTHTHTHRQTDTGEKQCLGYMISRERGRPTDVARPYYTFSRFLL